MAVSREKLYMYTQSKKRLLTCTNGFYKGVGVTFCRVVKMSVNGPKCDIFLIESNCFGKGVSFFNKVYGWGIPSWL